MVGSSTLKQQYSLGFECFSSTFKKFSTGKEIGMSSVTVATCSTDTAQVQSGRNVQDGFRFVLSLSLAPRQSDTAPRVRTSASLVIGGSVIE